MSELNVIVGDAQPVQGHSDLKTLKASDLWNKSVMSAEQLLHPSPTNSSRDPSFSQDVRKL